MGDNKQRNCARREQECRVGLNENTLVALLLLPPEVCVHVRVTRPVMTDVVPRCFAAEDGLKVH